MIMMNRKVNFVSNLGHQGMPAHLIRILDLTKARPFLCIIGKYEFNI